MQNHVSFPMAAPKPQANRENATHSTGPRTAAGKKRSALNAPKHGLLAQEVVITEGKIKEDPQQFSSFHSRLFLHYQPEGPVEEILVEKIAVCYWRLRRCLRAEQGEVIVASLEVDQKTGENLLTIGNPNLQKQEVLDYIDGCLMSKAAPGQASGERLLKYEAAVQRQLDKAMAQLERFQRVRSGEFVPPPMLIIS